MSERYFLYRRDESGHIVEFQTIILHSIPHVGDIMCVDSRTYRVTHRCVSDRPPDGVSLYLVPLPQGDNPWSGGRGFGEGWNAPTRSAAQ